jgi:hypothetical protein|tara:strand:+ start:174 stop:1310 length:1137 start_codon:yes stop_codon:yes gene_type:complete
MKIGVVGGGNGGLTVALTLLNETFERGKKGGFLNSAQDVEIEVYYDPNVPIEKVGQGSLINFVGLLSDVLGMNWYDNPIDATFKTGILYEGWGNQKDKFFHPFPFDSMSIHYSPSKLREYMIEKKVCKFIEQNVEDCNDIDCDYVFDCRGTPTDFSYYNMLKNPLNSVVLGQDNYRDPDQNWTRCSATPDGWCFGIPNKGFTSYGYLYNDKYTTNEDAKANMKEMFGVDATDTLHFKNYLARKPIVNDKVILNGNRLMFIEPLEASSVETYHRWTLLVCEWIFDGRSKREILQDLVTDVEEVQNFVLWHYATGSKYATMFWSEAEEMARSHSYDEVFFDFIREAKGSTMKDLVYDDGGTYAHWYATSFKNWVDGTQPI